MAAPIAKKRPNRNKESFPESDTILLPTPMRTSQVSHIPLSFLFVSLVIARMFAATFSVISDCDETYNYWEPLHYLVHQSGMQTWEYSPIYALRSYAYLWLHAAPLKIVSLFTTDKVCQFYFLRSALAIVCAGCEVYFYRAVCKQCGYNTAKITALFLLFSPAMFISSTALLPSSFTMYTTMVAMSAWFLLNYKVSILAVAAGAIVGWPFAAVLGAPIAYDLLVKKGMFQFFLKWCLISLLVFLIPLVAIDTYYYGRFVVTPFNIVLYNVFSGHGPDLYGVSPMSYYFFNGFLNFNLAFVLALISLPLWVFVSYRLKISDTRIPTHLTLVPMYLWIAIFFTRPHKEERFLFPMYPLIALSAGISLDCIQKLYALWFPQRYSQHYTKNSPWLPVSVIFVFTILSLSRSVALYKAYHAPLDVYQQFYQLGTDDPTIHSEKTVNLCVGKEWYRFPTSFFLPNNAVHLQFIQSQFKGQLPKAYDTRPHATRFTPTHMNDANMEETSRYVNISRCDYLIDLASSDIGPLQPDYSADTISWTTVYSHNFLDHSKSHSIWRAFYVPWLSEVNTVYTQYNLLKAKTRHTTRHKH